MTKLIIAFIILFAALLVASWFLIRIFHIVIGSCVNDMLDIKSYYNSKLKQNPNYTYADLCRYVQTAFYSVRNKPELDLIFQPDHEYYVLRFMKRSSILMYYSYIYMTTQINSFHNQCIKPILRPEYRNILFKNICKVVRPAKQKWQFSVFWSKIKDAFVQQETKQKTKNKTIIPETENSKEQTSEEAKAKMNKQTCNEEDKLIFKKGMIEACILSILNECELLYNFKSIANYCELYSYQFGEYSVDKRYIQRIFNSYGNNKASSEEERLLLHFPESTSQEQYNIIKKQITKGIKFAQKNEQHNHKPLNSAN